MNNYWDSGFIASGVEKVDCPDLRNYRFICGYLQVTESNRLLSDSCIIPIDLFLVTGGNDMMGALRWTFNSKGTMGAEEAKFMRYPLSYNAIKLVYSSGFVSNLGWGTRIVLC